MQVLQLNSAFSDLSASRFGNGSDGDGGYEGREAFEVGKAFGLNADDSEIVFAELVGQPAERPAKHYHISGGERDREFLRRLVLVVLRIGVRFQGLFDQLGKPRVKPNWANRGSNRRLVLGPLRARGKCHSSLLTLEFRAGERGQLRDLFIRASSRTCTKKIRKKIAARPEKRVSGHPYYICI